MENHKISGKQLGAWLFGALSAPLAQLAGGTSWPVVLVLGAVCLTGSWIVNRHTVAPGKLVCVAEYIWILCVLGGAARWMAESWPSGNVYPAVPLVLLALGAASASRGVTQAASAGSVLFWLLALVYSIVAIAGIGEVDPSLLLTSTGMGDAGLAAVFLFPAVAAFIPETGKKLPKAWLLAIAGFGTAVSVLIAGSLSPSVAQTVSMPLYQWVRGLGLLGTLERFESVVAVALTMGWFSALSYLLCAAGSLAEHYGHGCYRLGVWLCAALTGVGTFFDRWLSGAGLAIGSILLWVAVPIGCVLREKIKMEKFKNNA